ncbi:MAG: AraC family transcriptional regulator [Clostridia bacterium]|nr:AraC family transcriptional regulator [Clostridia bacterium]
MNVVFNLDISEKSFFVIHTPCVDSKQLPFHVLSCGHFLAGPDYFTTREGMDNYLLVLTLSGEGYLEYADMQVTLKPNQVFLINCSLKHSYRTGSCGSWEIEWVHFNGNACHEYYKLINEEELNIINLADSKCISKYFEEISQTMSGNYLHNDVKLSMLMTNILTELYMSKLNPIDNVRHSELNEMLDNVISFVQENYQKKITINDMAQIAHLSKYYFLRVFKGYTGLSPYEYLINYRINRSKLMLKETCLTVEAVAYNTGFNNTNNYIRHFKKIVGTTPLKYRNYWIT